MLVERCGRTSEKFIRDLESVEEEEERSGVEKERKRQLCPPSSPGGLFLQHPSTSSWISGVKKSGELLHKSP